MPIKIIPPNYQVPATLLRPDPIDWNQVEVRQGAWVNLYEVFLPNPDKQSLVTGWVLASGTEFECQSYVFDQQKAMKTEGVKKELAALLNRHGIDNAYNTPDFILADYLLASLKNLDAAMAAREGWLVSS